jgi:parvulin-like peptidyl-prolyl isomerase
VRVALVIAAWLVISPATAVLAGPTAQAAPIERVVAVVNDTVILQSELDARLLPMRAEVEQIANPVERKRRLAKLASQLLDAMIDDELKVQAAEQAKVQVDSCEVQAAVEQVKKQYKLDDASLEREITAEGYTMQSYKAELRRQLLLLRAVNQLVSPKVTVTDDDVRARFDQLQRRSESVAAVRLSHILIKVPDHASEQQRAEAKDKAAKAIERVKGGEEFAKVAADASDDTSTKQSGGELGWFERGSVNPEWEPVVFSMDKGDVRGPVTGHDGLHVFYVTEIKQSDLKPFAEMKEEIGRDLRRRELDKATQAWVDELRKNAYIDNKLQ